MDSPEIDAFQVLESVDVKVGQCSVKDLMETLNPCMRTFYLEYRENPNIDCVTNYNKMRECVKNKAKWCFEGIDIDDRSAENVLESIVNESLPIEDAETFCERSGFDVSLYPDEDGIKYCTDDFYAKSETITNNFNTLYNDNRGSRSLCQEYEAYGKSILDMAKEKCRPSLYRFMLKQMGWAESKELNPFCSEDQVLESS